MARVLLQGGTHHGEVIDVIPKKLGHSITLYAKLPGTSIDSEPQAEIERPPDETYLRATVTGDYAPILWREHKAHYIYYLPEHERSDASS